MSVRQWVVPRMEGTWKLPPPEILEIYEILIWQSFTTALAFIMSTD